MYGQKQYTEVFGEKSTYATVQGNYDSINSQVRFP